jgi:hypothetical protein
MTDIKTFSLLKYDRDLVEEETNEERLADVLKGL